MTDDRLGTIKISPQQEKDAEETKDTGSIHYILDDKDTFMLTKKQTEHEIDEHKRSEEFIKDTQQDRAQRKNYALWIYILVCCWLFMVLGLVGVSGTQLLNLSDTVLVALLTGVSVNVIALMAIVANYLFPKTGRKHKDYHDG